MGFARGRLSIVMLAAAAGASALAGLAAAPPAVAPEARMDPRIRELDEWRAARDKRLRSEEGWLTLVGLTWLEPGENLIGTDSASSIVLPKGTGPARAGAFHVEAGKVRLTAAPDADVTVGGKPAAGQEIHSDAEAKPDDIRVGRLRLTLIRRGEKLGIRMKDPQSPVRTGFRGIDSFPASLAWRIEGTFVPYDKPREVEIATVLGTTEKMQAPGIVRFTVAGQELTLEPVLESPEDKELFFIFRDATSGKETYGAGRFLYAPKPQDGKITLDFNRAYNPPCVFTPYATCPLPPKKNWLPVRIEAGEKNYGAHP